MAALKGYEEANAIALRLWEEVYASKGTPLIALTDTFATQTFLKVRSFCPDHVSTLKSRVGVRTEPRKCPSLDRPSSGFGRPTGFCATSQGDVRIDWNRLQIKVLDLL